MDVSWCSIPRGGVVPSPVWGKEGVFQCFTAFEGGGFNSPVSTGDHSISSLTGTKRLFPVLGAALVGTLLMKWDLSCLADSCVEGRGDGAPGRCTASYL